MALVISGSMQRELPASVKSSLSEMDEQKQGFFEEEFKRKKVSPGLMVFLAIFFPIHFFFVKKVGLFFLYFFTAGGFGIWYFVEWFLAAGRAKRNNEDLAQDILISLRTA